MTRQLAEFPAPGTRPPRRMPPALRDPLRAATLVGVALLIIGALLPWIHAFRPGTGWFDISGFEQAGDGGIVLELAIVAGILVWSNRAWNSHMAIVVAAPTLLAITCLAIMRVSYDVSQTYLRLLANAGGHGTYQVGFWLVIAGGIVTAIAGSIAIWRARGRLRFSIGGAGRIITGALGALVGGGGGFIVGSQIADLLTQGSTVGASAILITFAFALMFVGAWLGATLAVAGFRALQRS